LSSTTEFFSTKLHGDEIFFSQENYTAWKYLERSANAIAHRHEALRSGHEDPPNFDFKQGTISESSWRTFELESQEYDELLDQLKCDEPLGGFVADKVRGRDGCYY